MSNIPWIEKYRPQELDEIIFSDSETSTIFNKMVEDKSIPHLLLCGAAGSGKTSLARVLANKITSDVLYINASDENSVDVIRTKVKDFCSVIGFEEQRIVLLDECLDENTLVHILRDGTDIKVPIRDIDDKNDLVKSYNIETNIIEYMPFSLFDKGMRDDCYEIEFDDGEVVICTPEHKWYVLDNNKQIVVKASELCHYNHVLSPI